MTWTKVLRLSMMQWGIISAHCSATWLSLPAAEDEAPWSLLAGPNIIISSHLCQCVVSAEASVTQVSRSWLLLSVSSRDTRDNCHEASQFTISQPATVTNPHYILNLNLKLNLCECLNQIKPIWTYCLLCSRRSNLSHTDNDPAAQ